MIRTSIHVECDYCQHRLPYCNTPLEARTTAMKEGWLVGQHSGSECHLCPACRLVLPYWWPDHNGTRFWWEEEADWEFTNQQQHDLAESYRAGIPKG